MSKSFEKYQKRRLRASYLSVVLSITLVLLLVGFLGLTVLKYTKLSGYFKEKVSITLFLKNNMKGSEKTGLEKYLKEKEYVKKIHFVSRDQAAKEFSKDIGEDFLTFLGDNPLKSYFELGLKADFVSPAQLIYIAKELEKNAFIEEVSYDAPLVDLLTRNIKTIGFWLLIGASVLSFIAILLLNSSIRLSIYSKRFTIKTMQMVGATKSFIRKPFIWASVRLGLVGAFLASAMLLTFCYKVDSKLPALALLEDIEVLAMVVSGVFAVAFVITALSSFFATQRFLRLKTDQLYF
ncbi:ABC transporter permease [Wenyingzhuangia sp. 2_MG-2023]|uniref:cell division protein FtsX n=1 Tax=Wenyingzhuangia sp. 2_MG-2023 TaxID=3062639 RepID=UPI0026E3CB60|nr:permease-like cell division protein FtsX [Wenyingzhuangia sp. 2_MG-2023]MDO6738348.1 permease-like cell division protein FtsX [Wenyingzhuangia sp. 2_MG-2023]MDO6803906.1 permease-like cell division protein FtsX [Wenyingzhuangia sp. 1_MG-2023]